MLFVHILLALVALAIGIWLGLPGRYDRSEDEIDQIMDSPGRRKRSRVKRHFTPLAWFQRRAEKRERPTRTRSRFHLKPPDQE